MSSITEIPEVGTSGDYAADREPLHVYIRAANSMLMGRGDPERLKQLRGWRDEAQARLDAHAALDQAR